MPKPRIVILAGPNGAGKTTASTYLLRDALRIGAFVNADTIAAGLSGFAPESVAFEAGRMMLKRINSLVEQQATFAFETTLSSKTFANLISRAHERSYETELIYLALPSAEVAIERVAARVKAGGHNIPTNVITRRFYRSLSNLFELYIPLVNRWRIFDNYAEPPAPVASGEGHEKVVTLEKKWIALNELAQKE
jgi:predicted ABC-type ATPase